MGSLQRLPALHNRLTHYHWLRLKNPSTKGIAAESTRNARQSPCLLANKFKILQGSLPRALLCCRSDAARTLSVMARNSKLLRRISPLAGLLIVLTVVYLVGNRSVSTGGAEGTSFVDPPGGRPASRPTSRPINPGWLKIATFNIDSGKGVDDKVDLARTASCLQQVDFAGLNEVHGFLGGEPKNQAVTLSELLHLPYLWVPVEKRWGQETFGNAVFTNLPVTHWQRVVLPTTRFGSKRNYLLTDVLWHGKTVHIITTHTDWKTGGAEQFEIVRDEFLKLPTPAILMGDLNTPPSADLIKNLKATPGVEEAIDQVLDKIPGRVDWIFLRGLHTKDAGEVPKKASDHPAYWASVGLK